MAKLQHLPSDNFSQNFSQNMADSSHLHTQNFNDFHQNNDESIQSDALKYQQSTCFAPIPKKLIILSVVLTSLGTLFLVGGIVDYLNQNEKRGAALIFFGCLTFIPGIFQSFQLIQAYRARSPEERA